jgi:hypothetical protein
VLGALGAHAGAIGLRLRQIEALAEELSESNEG